MSKICGRCKADKPETEFYVSKKGYVTTNCKICDKLCSRERYVKRTKPLVAPARDAVKRTVATKKLRSASRLGSDIYDILDAPTHEDQREAAGLVALL